MENLINIGADIEATDEVPSYDQTFNEDRLYDTDTMYMTPLHIAIIANQFQVAKILLEKGAKVDESIGTTNNTIKPHNFMIFA